MLLLSPPGPIRQQVRAGCASCWEFFARTAIAAAQATTEPVTYTSWWRSPVDNVRVGGAARSQHLHGLAIDATGPGARTFATELARLGWTVKDEGDHWHAQVFPRNPFP